MKLMFKCCCDGFLIGAITATVYLTLTGKLAGIIIDIV
jgi:hypothetical protein